MKTANYLFGITLIVLFVSVVKAQTPINKGFAFGLNLNQFQHDFGIGINVASPSFAKGNLVVRASANLQYLQHVELDVAEETWTGYGAFRLGLSSIGRSIADGIKLYGEGGAALLLPNDTFSDESAIIGVYGLFGFEFYMDSYSSFFFEAGGLGINSVAEKLPNNPIYANGFMMSVGWRIHLQK